ncbi:MAG: LAGLIDADG family homing endonuclease, partial [Promethearchaeota archaeon]
MSKDSNLFVPAIGSDEKVYWGRVTQISRHKANINAPLIEIITRSGRKIVATNSHSFLIRKENQIVAVKGKNLKKSDRIPVISKLSVETPKEYINLSHILPKNKFWYGSELKDVFQKIDTYGHQWKNHVDFDSIPVSTNRIYQLNRNRTKSLSLIQENYVFSSNLHNHEIRIPEIFPLDVETGWFFGIYIAEGNSNKWTSSIANVEPAIQEKIINFAERYNLKYKLKKKMGPFGPSQSIEIYSTVLGSLLGNLFGKTSKEKKIPDCILSASEEFIAALIRGYFDGDGNYQSSRNQIRAGSTSKRLRDGICLLLARLGIFTSKGSEKLKSFYTISIPSKYAEKWYRIIGSDIPHKLEELRKIALNKNEKKTSYDIIDMIPGIGNVLNDLRKQSNINSKTSEAASIRKFTKKDLIGRQVLGKYINLIENNIQFTHENLESLKKLKNAYNSHIIWDEIVSIRTLLNFPFVYDFSVDYYENFLTTDGIFTHNTLRTFHYAGVSEFSVTQGLPRLIEIVDARRNPSTPIMRIFLDEKHRFDKDKARYVHSQIEQIKFETISSDIEIDLTEYTINISLIDELLEDKNLTIDDIKKKLKKFDKKGNIEFDEDYNMIIINPNTEDLQKLQKIKEKISKTLIQGVRGIKRGMIHKQHTDLCPQGEYTIQTEGTNLGEILTKIEGIDATRTVSNHIHEIEKFLGIEA